MTTYCLHKEFDGHGNGPMTTKEIEMAVLDETFVPSENDTEKAQVFTRTCDFRCTRNAGTATKPAQNRCGLSKNFASTRFAADSEPIGRGKPMSRSSRIDETGG